MSFPFLQDAESKRKANKKRQRSSKWKMEHKVQLFLIMLRHGLSLQLTGYLFQVPKSTLGDYFNQVLTLMHANVVPCAFYPQEEAVVRSNTPKDFAKAYSSVCGIIDGLPLPMQDPSIMALKRLTYSSYKKDNKFLVSVGKLP